MKTLGEVIAIILLTLLLMVAFEPKEIGHVWNEVYSGFSSNNQNCTYRGK